VIGGAMLRPRRGGAGAASVPPTRAVALRVGGVGLGVGLLSGFFGIGGGFLIVPGLILATGMSMINAASGLVDWMVAAQFIAGGIAGGWLGMRAACHLAADRNMLNRIFAGIVFTVAVYIIWRSAGHA
jgi:uncharacterized protein